jgi:hypothetical protein
VDRSNEGQLAPVQHAAPPPVLPAARSSAVFASSLIPGLGQFLQGRRLAGTTQLATVLAYLGGALALGSGRALALALLWNAWSVVDAWWWQRGENDPP